MSSRPLRGEVLWLSRKWRCFTCSVQRAERQAKTHPLLIQKAVGNKTAGDKAAGNIGTKPWETTPHETKSGTWRVKTVVNKRGAQEIARNQSPSGQYHVAPAGHGHAEQREHPREPGRDNDEEVQQVPVVAQVGVPGVVLVHVTPARGPWVGE